MTKTCSKCGLEKPYFPEEKKDSKASGFMGAVCWDCYRVAHKALIQLRRSTEEGRKKHNSASVKSVSARLKRDAWFRLKQQLSGETNRLVQQVATGKGRDKTIFAHFGATREEVHAHIDAQLHARGFEWKNYGKAWVLDHIRPLAIAQDSNELLLLCRLENTQVLTPAENRKKGAEDQKLIRQHESGV